MAKNYSDNFGAKFLRALKVIREESAELGLPIHEISSRVGIGRNTIRRWETDLPAVIETMVELEEAIRAERAARGRRRRTS